MRAVAHSPSFAKKTGIPQAVGRKFESHRADGPKEPEMMKKPLPPFMQKEAKKPADKAKGKKELPPFMKKDAKPKKMAYGGKAC
jgi:hypothetical protein